MADVGLFGWLAILPGALIIAEGRHPGDRPRLWQGGPVRTATAVVRWRVGVRWYAVALLTVPLLMTAILFAFSLTPKAFLRGLVASFFEEIG